MELEEVHDCSMDLLQFLEDSEVRPEIGITALALSLARLGSPRTLTPEEQTTFVNGILEFCAMFHTEGTVH